jgi:hypothetical protein
MRQILSISIGYADIAVSARRITPLTRMSALFSYLLAG